MRVRAHDCGSMYVGIYVNMCFCMVYMYIGLCACVQISVDGLCMGMLRMCEHVVCIDW